MIKTWIDKRLYKLVTFFQTTALSKYNNTVLLNSVQHNFQQNRILIFKSASRMNIFNYIHPSPQNTLIQMQIPQTK